MTTVRFQKIVPSGQAFAYHEGKAIFCLGPLPEELCEIEITKETSTYALARLVKIIEISPKRASAATTYPYALWNDVEYAYQLELKRVILEESFAALKLEISEVAAAPVTEAYRNKLTFALIPDGDMLALGMHERGSKDVSPTPEGCVLGHSDLNTAALGILDRLNVWELRAIAEQLTVRRSGDGKIVAVLLVNVRKKADYQSLRAPGLAGLIVRTKTEIAWTTGETTLIDMIAGTEVMYPADEFMQVNLPAFELALADIMAQIKPTDHVLDLYGGAGTIGLPIAKTTGATVLGVEINGASVIQAKASAVAQDLNNYKSTTASAEGLADTLFDGIDTIIVDPPRAGLSKAIIEQLHRLKPARIMYLSCDPTTQARDVKALSLSYAASPVKGYDFYPQTPHLESLVTLTLS